MPPAFNTFFLPKWRLTAKKVVSLNSAEQTEKPPRAAHHAVAENQAEEKWQQDAIGAKPAVAHRQAF